MRIHILLSFIGLFLALSSYFQGKIGFMIVFSCLAVFHLAYIDAADRLFSSRKHLEKE